MAIGFVEFVLDNSVTMTWCFPDESNNYAEDVLKSLPHSVASVPSLWPLEVANILLVGERRRRINQADSTAFVRLLQGLPIQIDSSTCDQAMTSSLDLARAHGLSVYDATYLELSLRRGIPIATLDHKLRTTATSLGVHLYQPT